jgi:polyhydroxyalkanoate synthesis regulator phasin
MSNINYESSNGIALMREMTEIELNNLTGTFDVALKELPKLTADNASEMADTFVTRMQGLDADTLTILRGTSDTMAVLFEGIYENMSKEDAHNKFTANLESMAKSGEFTSDKISQDISDAMNLIDKNVMDGSERVKQSAQNMFDNLTTISQFGMDATVENVVSSVNNMSDETIAQLASMGGHWETLFGGIALTGKDAIGDMEGHIKGRLQELSQTSPQFVAEMEAQMSAYFEQANTNGSTSIDELSNNVEADSKQIEQSMDIHTKDGTNALNTNLDKGAKDVSKSLNAIKNTTNTDMGSANNAMQQNATTMYKGVSTSFYKMEQKAKQSSTDMMKGVNTSTHKMANESRQDASHMHNGVRDSASAMSLKVRQSASEMYKGVTTSTRKMADAAISDWNRVRKAYSKPITGTVTKTTVNKSISAQSKVRSIPTNNDIPTIASLEPTYQLRTPDISDFAISSRYYNSSYSERVSITKAKHNDSNKDNISKTNELLNQLISLMKNNNLNNEDIIIQVNLEGEKIVDYVSKKMARNVRKRM